MPSNLWLAHWGQRGAGRSQAAGVQLGGLTGGAWALQQDCGVGLRGLLTGTAWDLGRHGHITHLCAGEGKGGFLLF